MEKNKTLIAFFSRRGENFNVGSISRGNGEIISSMLASLTGFREYEICTADGYPADLAECNKIAKKELEERARPELRNVLPDMSGVGSLLLVYPNWWGNLPMPVYSFLDAIDTDGLDIYPICTHEDNGLAMTERILKQAYPKANIMKGIAVRGSVIQNDRNHTESIIVKYLSDRNLIAK